MAVGFTPRYSNELALPDLTQQQYIALGIEAAKSLGWDIVYTSNAGFKAYTNKNVFLSTNQLIKVVIVADNVYMESSSLGSEMVDFGKNKKNVNQLITAIEELTTDFSTQELELKYEALTLVADEDDDLTRAPATASENFKSFFSIFVPQNGYFITPILLNLNLLVFILMLLMGVDAFNPDGESLIRWGANFKPVTTNGEPWRLLTNCFLHIGILHLLMNMYALVYIGVILEPYLGKVRFAAAYLLAGIGASAASLWWHDMTISAGASGAIFGMYGVFLALLTTDFIPKDIRKSLLTSIMVFVGYNLLNGLKGGIDNAAHIGGLASGLVIGYALIPSLKKPDMSKLELNTILLLTVFIFCTSFMVYNKTSYDFAKYDNEIKAFVRNESQALEVYKLPADATDATLMYEIKDRGIYYWNENIKLVGKLDKLNLPEVLHERNRTLKKYCELRIKCYELMYKSLEERNKEKYNTEIQALAQQIEGTIKAVQGKTE
ncbi:MAG: rhomboid family intramembrane serine protease [Candidatus Pedobacter colombiensis]|uniref:Rhomboid family intramembrane serine protease n=1 Tax=Candidatus Pedobacter colombiensis TaxID=3121371 RepID=A0AAJ5W5N9_9SPHI|nr:rhomboid family intramembrane serine protease [Pedobacter sp.]WEK17429.1 MAG: rhomboid family intramembrane serine protease [Pedobacter sp.]